MSEISRRGLFGLFAAAGAAGVVGPKLSAPGAATTPSNPANATASVDPIPTALWGTPLSAETKLMHAQLRARVGEEIYTAWFYSLAVERLEGSTLTVSFPVKFLRTWVQAHYREDVLACAQMAFGRVQRVEFVLRRPGQRVQSLQS